MNKNFKKSKGAKKRIKAKPPFYWSIRFQLLVAILLIVEIGFFISNRSWSQYYSLNIEKIRGQVEKLNLEQELIAQKISAYYRVLEGIEKTGKLTEAQRVILTHPRLTLVRRVNNE